MFVSYDSDADAVYVKLRPDIAEPAETRELDTWRYLDYADDGGLVGVEFLRASHGIELTGVPESDRVAAAIRALPDLAERFLRAS